MSTVSITQQESGRCLIQGEMSFSTVNQLLGDGQRCLVPSSALIFDLSGVNHADSAGVALLVEWLRLARQQQVELKFQNIPQQMWSIIEVSDLDERLPLTLS